MIKRKKESNLRDIIINEIMIPALMVLYRVDYDNINDGVSERNICARLALHMENIMRRYDRAHNTEIFKGYYADVEYDKMNHREQKFYENYLHERKRMVSDLLIQSRGEKRNLLAIEMKRWKSIIKKFLIKKCPDYYEREKDMDPKERQKILAYLYRKGFSYDKIADIMKCNS